MWMDASVLIHSFGFSFGFSFLNSPFYFLNLRILNNRFTCSINFHKNIFTLPKAPKENYIFDNEFVIWRVGKHMRR